MEEYKKKLIDTMNWEEIKQLHASVLEISKQCFEYKKIYVAVLGVVSAALLQFNNQTLYFTLMLISVFANLISIIFLICDAIAYYYQRKNRQRMEDIKNHIYKRYNIFYISKNIEVKYINSIFNLSMVLYYIIILFSSTYLFIYFHENIC